MIWFVTLVAWPLLVTGALLFFRRRRLGRKRAFAAVSFLVGIVVLAFAAWATSEALPSFIEALELRAYVVFLGVMGLAIATPYAVALAAMWVVSQRFLKR